MFKSLRSCAGALAITAIVGVPVAGLAAPAGAAAGGNSTNAAKLCQRYRGTLGNTNMTLGSWPTILWTCNDWPWRSDADLQAKYVSLGSACLAGGGTGYAVFGAAATMTAYFTCGKA
ncbi:MAG: hypothetical protein ABJD24_02690 [Acidimicrobiales bacterium]